MTAARTLLLLEQTLKRHLDELVEIPCEDQKAANIILAVIKTVEDTLANVKTAKADAIFASIEALERRFGHA